MDIPLPNDIVIVRAMYGGLHTDWFCGLGLMVGYRDTRGTDAMIAVTPDRHQVTIIPDVPRFSPKGGGVFWAPLNEHVAVTDFLTLKGERNMAQEIKRAVGRMRSALGFADALAKDEPVDADLTTATNGTVVWISSQSPWGSFEDFQAAVEAAVAQRLGRSLSAK